MKYNPHFLLLIIFCFLAVNSAAAQITAADAVKFQISLANGKTVYRIGEPVSLVLSYTTAESPEFVVESYYSPLFDDVILSPADGIYPWLYRWNRMYSYDDVSVPQKLSASPININLTINNLVRFDKPGKYKVKVLSRRVWTSTGKNSFRDHPIPLFSNEIEFEIKEMSQAEEQAEVTRIAGLMDSAKNLNQHQLYKHSSKLILFETNTTKFCFDTS